MKRKNNIPVIYIVIILIVAIYTGFNISSAVSQKNEKSKQFAENQTEIETLKSDITNLEKEKESSNSLEFVEKVAREDLGMVKPREVVYIDKNKADDKNE